MLDHYRLTFRSTFELRSNLREEDLPLRFSALKKIGRSLDSECKGLPLRKAWQKTMGVAPRSWCVSFCDDRWMRKIQKQFRNLDRATDVLSFPALENPELRQIYKKLPMSERSLGDVLIAIPTVARGARRGRRSQALELLEVLIHSYLHLLGYDHVVGKKNGVKAKDAALMKSIQAQLFKKLAKKLRIK